MLTASEKPVHLYSKCISPAREGCEKIFLKSSRVGLQIADDKCRTSNLQRNEQVNVCAFCFMVLGYGFGFEGVDGDRVYLGTYTPTHEYGWVVEDGEIWLDVVMEKNEKNLKRGG